MYKAILFTHDDMDGAGCRIVFEIAFALVPKEQWDVVICSNKNVDDKVREHIPGRCTDDIVIIFADICCSDSTLRFLNDMFKNVMVFDHHITNKYADDILGDNSHVAETSADGRMQSGTSILYNYFNTTLHHEWYQYTFALVGRMFREHRIGFTGMDEFVDTIRSYDTYEWKSTNNEKARQLQTLFGILGMERFCHYYKKLFLNCRYGGNTHPVNIISDEQLEFVNVKLENEQKIIDQFTPDNVISVGVMGYSAAMYVGVVYANISELAYQFLTKYTEYDIFVHVSLKNGGSFEFRTIRDDINTGELIAEPIGGGGHAKSSGAPIDESIMRSFKEALIAQLNQKLLIGDEY